MRVGEDLERLVRTYWAFHRSSTGEGGADDRARANARQWAWEEVQQAVADRDPDVVDLLERLAEAAPSPEALAYLGAGPIEDLLHVDDPTLIARVEAASRRSTPLRSALASVWYDGEDERIEQLLHDATDP